MPRKLRSQPHNVWPKLCSKDKAVQNKRRINWKWLWADVKTTTRSCSGGSGWRCRCHRDRWEQPIPTPCGERRERVCRAVGERWNNAVLGPSTMKCQSSSVALPDTDMVSGAGIRLFSVCCATLRSQLYQFDSLCGRSTTAAAHSQQVHRILDTTVPFVTCPCVLEESDCMTCGPSMNHVRPGCRGGWHGGRFGVARGSSCHSPGLGP